MRKATAILLAAAIIGTIDAVLAASTFEKKKRHEAMQSAIEAAKDGPQPAEDSSIAAPQETRQRRSMGEWIDAFRDRHYIELDTDE